MPRDVTFDLFDSRLEAPPVEWAWQRPRPPPRLAAHAAYTADWRRRLRDAARLSPVRVTRQRVLGPEEA